MKNEITVLAEELERVLRTVENRRTRGPAYKHSRWARCVFCGILRKYKVSAARRLRSQSCQECNRKGGLHPPNWKGWHQPDPLGDQGGGSSDRL